MRAEMKLLLAICFSLSFLIPGFGQGKPSPEQSSAPIGLAIGQKAPRFALRDQFGRQQTLDSLKGPNGTVLLFFRSADW